MNSEEALQLEQRSCEDAISRKEVLDCIKATELKKFDYIIDMRDKVKNLPSVTPIRPKGHWISQHKYFLCSICGNEGGLLFDYKTKYCLKWFHF